MNARRIIILMIIVSIIVSCNVISASDPASDNLNINEDMQISESNSDDVEIIQNEENFQELVKKSSNEEIISSSEATIYVGTNSTPDGKGTKEDPFANLNLACNNYNAGEQKDKVTVNINDGTYYLDSFLKFNTNNLNIIGNGKVVIKNSDSVSHQSFGSNCNFTMSNIIFNASDFNSLMDTYYNSGTIAWFTPFVGSNGNVIFDNCTFTDYNHVDPNTDMNYVLPPIDESFQGLYKNDNMELNQCKFINSHGFCFLNMMYDPYALDLRFNYCSFSVDYGMERFGSYDNANLIFDDCWLGHNSIDSPMFYDMGTPSSNPGHYSLFSVAKMTISRYAILTISENYLGNNEYELIGKLIWNDSTDDNIDKLGSMIVYLSADNGNIPSEVTLENGSFNVTYTAESEFHEIVARLDNQKINLNNKISFALDAPIINYGDNQNITVTFPEDVKGTVYVTIGNNTYKKYCDNLNSVIVPIDDNLAKGSYDIDVSFVSDKNVVLTNNYYDEFYSFGFNSSKLTILGFDSKINVDNESEVVVVSLTNAEGNPIKGATVTYNTTSGVEGSNVTGDDGKFNIIGLTGEFTINVTYTGNESYNPSNKSASFNFKLPAVKTTLTINSTEKGIVVITVVDNENKPIANLEVKYSINGANSTNTTGADGTISIPVTGEGEIKAYFEGNEAYIKSENSYKYNFTETTPNTNGTSTNPGKTNTDTNKQTTTKVTKKATKITAKKATFKAKKKTKKYTITLKAGKKAVKKVKVTLKIGKKTYKAKTNSKGKATFNLKKLTKKGQYAAVIKFAGNKNYKSTSKKVKITVKK